VAALVNIAPAGPARARKPAGQDPGSVHGALRAATVTLFAQRKSSPFWMILLFDSTMRRFESSHPASQSGLYAVISGCLRIADIPAGQAGRVLNSGAWPDSRPGIASGRKG